jgi:hypothetical protein
MSLNPDTPYLAAQRERFEQACFDHYLGRHADGKTGDHMEPPGTRPDLMWRDEKGEYGVLMFNAAWWAWQAALVLLDVRAVALEKINAIRNSIIGFQKVGWSDHVYPLVAALQEAGIEGAGYDVASANVQKELDIRLALEKDKARLDILETAVENGCVTMCFEMDGGVHLTLDGVGEAQEAYRNESSIRDALSKMVAKAGA